MGSDLGQDMGPDWDSGRYPPWGTKFGLEKNFCSTVWKHVLSVPAKSEVSIPENEGAGPLFVCWDIDQFLNSEKLGPGT